MLEDRNSLQFTWTPDMGAPPDTPRIGEALIAAGLLDEEQLENLVERQQRSPYFTLGQLASLIHRVPMAAVDAECVRAMLLPQVGPVLLEELSRFAAKDRFAKNLDPRRFIQEIHLRMRRFEVMHIDSRSYRPDEEGRPDRVMKRYVLTQGSVEVQLRTNGNGQVLGQVQVRHDSLEQRLQVVDDPDTLKTALYYELRTLYHRLTPESA